MPHTILPMEVLTLKLVRNLLIATALTLPASLAWAAEVKIGFVSIAKILNSAPQAETASKRLEQEFAPRKKGLDDALKGLRKQEEKLAKDGAVMSESQRRNLENEIRNQARELKRTSDEFREDFNLRRNEELGKFQKQVLEVINGVAKEEGFDLVINDNATLYASPQVDVTDKVLKRLTSK
ncbi:MAG: OmpH family outer membrane protein [Candidatus Contendobacter sp.]|nr:OmpH family outer membrane protein [Candidatus Contendobacter sp.]MDS4059520.1 OmpH family outer membrane protein [Candidatus Contendobacter sp.]